MCTPNGLHPTQLYTQRPPVNDIGQYEQTHSLGDMTVLSSLRDEATRARLAKILNRHQFGTLKPS